MILLLSYDVIATFLELFNKEKKLRPIITKITTVLRITAVNGRVVRLILLTSLLVILLLPVLLLPEVGEFVELIILDETSIVDIIYYFCCLSSIGLLSLFHISLALLPVEMSTGLLRCGKENARLMSH